MKAVVMKDYGTEEVLELQDVKRPEPGPTEILVEVFASGLNPVDFKIREGELKELFPVSFPRILGGDISGVVTGLGKDATEFEVGDEVYFSNPLDRDGGNAEYVVVEQEYVVKKPNSLTHVEAASLPVVGLTSIQALRDFGGMKKGSKVLIHAGAGGVGSFAIQYAKSQGAIVFTTASKAKEAYVKSLGADRVIDYKTEDFVTVAQEQGGMDIVFETLGHDNYRRSILATKPGGAVPCIVNPPDEQTKTLAEMRNIKADFLLLQGKQSDLNEITRLVESGNVKPTVSGTLPLEQLKQAHQQLQSGRTQGKLVLTIH